MSIEERMSRYIEAGKVVGERKREDRARSTCFDCLKAKSAERL
jgi:hypothetical protein